MSAVGFLAPSQPVVQLSVVRTPVAAQPTNGVSSASRDGTSSSFATAFLSTGAVAVVATAVASGYKKRRGAARRAQRGDVPAVGRADLLRGSCGAAVASLTTVVGAPLPASAYDEAGAKEILGKWGVPQLQPKSVPFGWQAVCLPIGLTNTADYSRNTVGEEPLIVSFVCPATWVISKPNIDFNGTAGTVSANDYPKGDAAVLYVEPAYKKTFADMNTKDYRDIVFKALTQKGKGFVDICEVTKVNDFQDGYKLIEFDWQLYTPVGFTIARTGYAMFTQGGTKGDMHVFWTGATLPRWPNMKNDLYTIASSFRVGKVPEANVPDIVAEAKALLNENENYSQVLY